MAEALLNAVVVIFSFFVLPLSLGLDHANSFSATQLGALTQLGADTSQVTLEVSGILFGMGSLLFFYLFFVGRSIPRLFSGFGVAASLLIPGVCLVKLILPQYSAKVDLGWLPMGLAEISTGVWLVAKGVNAGTAGKVETS